MIEQKQLGGKVELRDTKLDLVKTLSAKLDAEHKAQSEFFYARVASLSQSLESRLPKDKSLTNEEMRDHLFGIVDEYGGLKELREATHLHNKLMKELREDIPERQSEIIDDLSKKLSKEKIKALRERVITKPEDYVAVQAEVGADADFGDAEVKALVLEYFKNKWRNQPANPEGLEKEIGAAQKVLDACRDQGLLLDDTTIVTTKITAK